VKIIKDIKSIHLPFKNAVMTIGNFDGVHIGHQALFHEVIKKAKAIDGTAIAMTFDPHPLRLLKDNNHPAIITPYTKKAELIARAGLNVLICVPFTMSFAAISPQAFIEDILVKKIGLKAVVVGRDYTFGKNRGGNLDMLKAYGKQIGFEVMVAEWVRPIRSQYARTSSTAIRELVMEGKIEEARNMLGRNYQISATPRLKHNSGIQSSDFFTFKIPLKKKLCPKTGTYTVTVEYRKQIFKGVAHAGYNSGSCEHIITIEAQGLNLLGNNSQKICVNFIKRLMDGETCVQTETLTGQIGKDIEIAGQLIAA